MLLWLLNILAEGETFSAATPKRGPLHERD